MARYHDLTTIEELPNPLGSEIEDNVKTHKSDVEKIKTHSGYQNGSPSTGCGYCSLEEEEKNSNSMSQGKGPLEEGLIRRGKNIPKKVILTERVLLLGVEYLLRNKIFELYCVNP